MNAGSAFLVPSGPNDKMHLHVVVVNHDKNDCVIWVSVCTVVEGIYNDDACLLSPGCHEFINHESFVSYNFASFANVVHIKNMVDKGYYKQKKDVSLSILEAIRGGLEKSNETPRGIKRSFLNWPNE